MGSIRFLLAVGVVTYHSFYIFGESFCGGRVSVELFFMISGFYMALILHEKYKPGKGSYKLFLTNRLLRIYPAYFVVLLLAVAVSFIGYHYGKPFYLWAWVSTWSQLSLFSIAVLVLLNITIVGQDATFFTCWDKQSGNLYFTDDPYLCKPMTGNFLFIPQAWSIGIEIIFYIVAPLITRIKWYFQLGIIIASLGIRYWTYKHFYDLDPWTYRFFPSEIAFFMAGSLAYKIYGYLKTSHTPQSTSTSLSASPEGEVPRARISYRKIIGYISWSLIIISIFIFPFVKNIIGEVNRDWVMFILLFITLPFIFLLTKNFRWDRALGELSYPIYICHHLVIMLIKPWFWGDMKYLRWFGLTSVVLSVAFSVVLYFVVIRPVERWRQRRAEGMVGEQ